MSDQTDFDKELDSIKIHLQLNLAQGLWLESSIKNAVQKHVIGEYFPIRCATYPNETNHYCNNCMYCRWASDDGFGIGYEVKYHEQHQSLWGNK